MIVLGWHGGILREFEDADQGWSTHDAAAALIVDGELVSAVEEERLNRIKHANCFPIRAIQQCLRESGVGFDQVDCVAQNFRERDREVFPCDAGLPSVERYLNDLDKRSFSVRESLCELFEREFHTDVSKKLFFCDHHEAHSWSTFAGSGYEKALVASIDGSGDAHSGSISIGNDRGLKILSRIPISESLGNLYSDTIRLLGYRRFDEYKVMGLAPLGDPAHFRKLFQSFYTLLPNGAFQLLPREARWPILFDAGLIQSARRAGQSFSRDHMDIAAALQETLEVLVFHILSYYRRATNIERLCLAGGVAHNCAVNGKLLQSGLFRDIFVQPASHDAGGAIGAAIAAVEADSHDRARHRITHVFLGGDAGSDDEVEKALSRWTSVVSLEHLADPARDTALLLAAGEVIGWVQGRSEFGPRALGHRSIIADPRPQANQDRINMMIKRRESFRPFAPSILEEYLSDLIEDTPGNADLSFMTYALNVKSEARSKLGAVTHVDGSARVQAVSRATDPLYWELIDHFRLITGVPAILNTSFNNDAEPIIDSVDDAVACFLTTELDGLVVNSTLVRKLSRDLDLKAMAAFSVVVPPSRKLVRRMGRDDRASYQLESTVSKYFARQSIQLSQQLFSALQSGPKLVSDILDDASSNSGISRELFSLWSSRGLFFHPARIE